MHHVRPSAAQDAVAAKQTFSLHPELLHYPPTLGVQQVCCRGHLLQLKRVESPINYGARGLGCHAPSPIRSRKRISEICNLVVRSDVEVDPADRHAIQRHREQGVGRPVGEEALATNCSPSVSVYGNGTGRYRDQSSSAA